jgi:cell division protein FtsZ
LIFAEESGSSQAKEMLDLFRRIFDSLPRESSLERTKASKGERINVGENNRIISSDDFLRSARSVEIDESDDEDSVTGNLIIAGVGGCGSNTIDNISKLGIRGIKLVAVNTDKVHLDGINAPYKVLIGDSITHGLGAGGRPEVARACAEQDAHKISDALGNRPDLVFIAAGMGGGTGTGAAPVVAKIAKDKGAKIIAFITLPFRTEGRHKYKLAQEGIRQLRKWADTVVLISNDKLMKLAGDRPLDEAFMIADMTLAVMVKGIAEIIRKRTMVNVDLNDIRTLMSVGGVAAVGIGESSDPKRRGEEAVKMALRNQLIEISPEGARGALVVVYGGKNMRLTEVHQITEIVASKMSSDAIIKIGADIDESLGDGIRVILLLTGIRSPDMLGPDVPLRTEPLTVSIDGKYDPVEALEEVLGSPYVL